MAHANVGLVLAIVAVVAVFACTKPAPAHDEGPPEPAQPSEAPPPVAAVESCPKLAQLYCENAPVDCNQLEQLLRATEVPDSACAEAVIAVEATLESLSGPQRDILPMVLARYLATVMLESPKLSEEQRARFTAMAGGPSAGALAESQVGPRDVVCPGVSQARGLMPMNGFERWCERDDGRRHGPALRWNDNGELVREIEYRDGEAVTVRFLLPDSQLLPPELFMCPSGHVERRERGGEAERRWCEAQSGDRSGPEVTWVGGRVASVSFSGDGSTSMVYPSARSR